MVLPTSEQIYNTYSQFFALRYSTDPIDDNLSKIKAFISETAEFHFYNISAQYTGVEKAMDEFKKQMPAGYKLLKVSPQEYEDIRAESHAMYELPTGECVVYSEVYTLGLENERCVITKIAASSRKILSSSKSLEL
jgi:hypothetical protein